ncbi:MAG: ferredoxin [Bacteroidales bacterium]|nr:ferredoxin [Bacteroidales bacterium]MDD4656676.1 ferredoxin [Bacteroidales bacterium]
MSIEKVWIEEGCIACGVCEDICPKVFVVEGEATVIEGADFNENEKCIKEAAEECPVEVIKFE